MSNIKKSPCTAGNLSRTYYKSDIGLLEILGNDEGIASIYFIEDDMAKEESKVIPTQIRECVSQLDEYFKGERKEFSVTLRPRGSKFQEMAWAELRKIPYGETIAYSRQAERMGNIKACRAVGGANGKNPISIVIPCHRVIGKNGSLTGFGAGTWRKEWLLKHEKKYK